MKEPTRVNFEPEDTSSGELFQGGQDVSQKDTPKPLLL
jgi:hypothetical protein